MSDISAWKTGKRGSSGKSTRTSMDWAFSKSIVASGLVLSHGGLELQKARLRAGTVSLLPCSVGVLKKSSPGSRGGELDTISQWEK